MLAESAIPPAVNPRPTLGRRVVDTLSFLRFSHTIFALPFALVAMLVAADGLPSWWVLGLILVCMVTARTAAMAFNRWADWEIDKRNPRTKGRCELATRRTAAVLVFISLVLFFFAAALLNPLTAALSPVAAVLVLGYSLTKRFTAYCHAALGIALAAAPMGAWAAVTGDLTSPIPWLLAAAVACWVFGFDLIYATLDAEFDRGAGLHSFPARYGLPATLALATGLHIAAWLLLAAFGYAANLGPAYGVALAISAGALIYEHLLSRSGDIGKINVAFFNMNALVGLALLAGTALTLYVPAL